MEFIICNDLTEYLSPNYDLPFAGDNIDILIFIDWRFK
jgi:hypothetical protein